MNSLVKVIGSPCRRKNGKFSRQTSHDRDVELLSTPRLGDVEEVSKIFDSFDQVPEEIRFISSNIGGACYMGQANRRDVTIRPVIGGL